VAKSLMIATIASTVDTEYSADSVEFCPIQDFQEYFVVGTYQVKEGATDSSPIHRAGQLQLYEDPNSATLVQKLETAAILDCKWSFQRFNQLPVLGVVTAKGEAVLYSLNADKMMNIVHRYQNDDDSTLFLSIDFQNRLSGSISPNLTVSCSDGSVKYLQLSTEGYICTASFNAHK
jgi:diphthamide biosynthesis protein 7